MKICPICGAPIESTSGMCAGVTSYTTDASGKIINMQHVIIVPPVIMRGPVVTVIK